MRNKEIRPFLRWPGGKRWFATDHRDLIPENYNTYFEPFLGGAALFFSMNNDNSVLADINGWLIDTYRAIKDDWRAVQRVLEEHKRKHNTEYYYEIRSRKCRTIHTKAAQLIYLNRTCWNGLFRLNKSGGFNVPIGDRSTIIYDYDDFEKISRKLKNASFFNQDFTKTINMASSGDFVYVDPPYTVKHNNNGFKRYNESIFSWNCQVQLRDCIRDAVSRGVKVLVSNANHSSVIDLYENLGEVYLLERSNMLSSDIRYRGIYEEIAIVCGYQFRKK